MVVSDRPAGSKDLQRVRDGLLPKWISRRCPYCNAALKLGRADGDLSRRAVLVCPRDSLIWLWPPTIPELREMGLLDV